MNLDLWTVDQGQKVNWHLNKMLNLSALCYYCVVEKSGRYFHWVMWYYCVVEKSGRHFHWVMLTLDEGIVDQGKR